MAPPLVKGNALVRRRIAGIVFILVLAMLVSLSVAMYQKRFTKVVNVSLQTDRIGNQLSVHSDVKVRGVVVGEVRSVRSEGAGATLGLALKPDKVGLLPRNVRAQLLPKTLFGEKEVVLVVPTEASSDTLHNGDVITQDNSSTALETETALNDLLPLLRTLQPEKLSEVLNSLSEATRGRGDRLGANLAQGAAYFHRLNPSISTAGIDLQGLADFANNLNTASPDLLQTLDNLSYSGRSLVAQRAALDKFLQSTDDFASVTRKVVADNQQRLIALSRDSEPVVKLYASYSNLFPCMLNRIAFSEIEGERVFGGHQAGLHITLEATQDHGGYVPGQEPQNKDTFNERCFGMGKKPIIPFPSYRNPQDGYKDSDPPEDPGKGPNGCCRSTAWYPPVTDSPSETVVRREPMPTGTSTLDALLIAPIAGSG